VVTLAQLQELGLSARAVRHRVATGRLVRVHRGVYAPAPPGPKGRWMAATLACGPGCVLSHRSAGALWGLGAQAGHDVDVSVRTRAGRSRAGIRAHCGDRLLDADVTVRAGIPSTTLARTLLDLAVAGDRRLVERAVDRAEELRDFDLAGVDDLLARGGGAPGTALLADVLAAHAAPTTTRSEAEERLLALVRDAGLPAPFVNRWIPLEGGGGCEADFLWPERRLIVEVDGRDHHATRAAFVRDRRRDRRLALAGYETRRYGATELVREPSRVVAELRAFLA
jgi:very-short-patch-repair endonuclease